MEGSELDWETFPGLQISHRTELQAPHTAGTWQAVALGVDWNLETDFRRAKAVGYQQDQAWVCRVCPGWAVGVT